MMYISAGTTSSAMLSCSSKGLLFTLYAISKYCAGPGLFPELFIKEVNIPVSGCVSANGASTYMIGCPSTPTTPTPSLSVPTITQPPSASPVMPTSSPPSSPSVPSIAQPPSASPSTPTSNSAWFQILVFFFFFFFFFFFILFVLRASLSLDSLSSRSRYYYLRPSLISCAQVDCIPQKQRLILICCFDGDIFCHKLVN